MAAVRDLSLSSPGEFGNAEGRGVADIIYQGLCDRCGVTHRLPRTALAERAAFALMAELGPPALDRPGKMYGVLVAAKTLEPSGETTVCRAFSGRLNGALRVQGWAPPVPEVDIEAEEARAFAEITALQSRLGELAADPVYVEVRSIEDRHEREFKALNARAARARAQRGRCWAGDPSEGRRQLRALRTSRLVPLRDRYDALMQEMAECTRRRRATSHALHEQIRASFMLPNFAGDTVRVEDAFMRLSPGGAGECCAPKLLVEAVRSGLRPLGMAEFWWGPTSPDGSKVSGRFYGPCAERCQPLLGHLLCDGGLSVRYRDQHLLVIDKPSGLAAVPGPSRATHDSVQARARLRAPGARAAHRLDVDTSGLLLVALDRPSLVGLNSAFRAGDVAKRYVAILEAPPAQGEGLVELRSAPDPEALPRHRVDPTGKVSRTRYRALDGCRVEFEPLTGRTHQIRLAASQGLGSAIVGDTLYGPVTSAGPIPRLMLHAAGLRLRHPISGAELSFASPPPF